MNPLQELKDIHIPAVIDIWPPAYGWWLLVMLVTLGIGVLTIWLLNVRKIRRAKRQTLHALQRLDSSSLDCVSQLNQLLKRVAMAYFPTQNIQKMHNENWTAFLVKTLPNNKVKDFSASFASMQQSLYQPHLSENTDFPSYQQSVQSWIKYALPPSKNMMKKLEQDNA